MCDEEPIIDASVLRLQSIASATCSTTTGVPVAAEEADILGLVPGEYHIRPDGAAPEGKAWSFRL